MNATAKPFSGPEKPCPLCDLPVATRANGTVKMHPIPRDRKPAHTPRLMDAWCEGGNPIRSGHLTYPAPAPGGGDTRQGD